MKVTINYLLAMEKALRERQAQLKSVVSDSTKVTIWLRSEGDKREEPTYDIKAVDKKILGINKALFEINHKIKESNALTTIEVEANFDELISPLE